MSMAYLDYGPWVRVSTFRSVFIVPVPAIRVYLSTHLGTAFTLNMNHGLFEQLGELKMHLRLTATDINGSKKDGARLSQLLHPLRPAKLFEGSA